VDEHEKGPSAMMRRAERDRTRGSDRGDRGDRPDRGDRGDRPSYRPREEEAE
jgi:small subunit ribosomal protein S6